MPEPTDSGTRVEYAVRYDAPEEYAGIVGNIRSHRSIAEGFARDEERHVGGEFKCTVVERTVTYGEWTPVAKAVADVT